MEAVVKNGTIILPEEIIKEVNFPKNGKCEVEVIEKEIRILKPAPTPKALIELLKNPITLPIDEIVRVSEPDID